MNKYIRINNILSDKSIKILNFLKAETTIRVYLDCPFFNHIHHPVDFDFITHILFETSTDTPLLQLLNKTIDMAEDNDEYALFEIKSVGREILDRQHRVQKLLPGNIPIDDYMEKYRWHITDIFCGFNTIQIYRDCAKWNYMETEWDVTTDVAIKFSGKKTDLLCILHDSIDSSMSVVSNCSGDENNHIDRYWRTSKWGMKSENLSFLQRSVISV